jgi:bacteriorhodopsin
MQVFYARYIDWAFTTPLLLLDLTLVAGLPAGEIAIAIIADIIMIVTGAIGALHPSLKYRACLRRAALLRWS